jgi:hypothetical protein
MGTQRPREGARGRPVMGPRRRAARRRGARRLRARIARWRPPTRVDDPSAPALTSLPPRRIGLAPGNTADFPKAVPVLVF